MDRLTPRELIPDAFRTTAHRLPSGTVVIVQESDSGIAQTIIVPGPYVKAFIDGVWHTFSDETMREAVREAAKP